MFIHNKLIRIQFFILMKRKNKMKTTLKTTALAILVALGATACLSNSGGGGSKEQPKQIQTTTVHNSSTSSTSTSVVQPGNEKSEGTKTDLKPNKTNDTKSETGAVSDSQSSSSVKPNTLPYSSVGDKLPSNIKPDEEQLKQGKLVIDLNEVDSAFLNNDLPYATYGVLETKGNQVGQEEDSNNFPVVARVQRNTMQNLQDIVDVNGATYKGNVIAAVHLYDKAKDSYYYHPIPDDGNVVLSLRKDQGKVFVKGVLNSKLFQEISLAETEVGALTEKTANDLDIVEADLKNTAAGNIDGEVQYAPYNPKESGYAVTFGGKNFENAAGTVSLNFHPDDPEHITEKDFQNMPDANGIKAGYRIGDYQATFGATKQ